MERASGGAPLQCEPIDAGGVEPVHGRPAVEPLADIGGHAFLAGELDRPWNEAVIAMAVDRRGGPDGRCPNAAGRICVRDGHDTIIAVSHRRRLRRAMGGPLCFNGGIKNE